MDELKVLIDLLFTDYLYKFKEMEAHLFDIIIGSLFFEAALELLLWIEVFTWVVRNLVDFSKEAVRVIPLSLVGVVYVIALLN